jgi:hypothetical protein
MGDTGSSPFDTGTVQYMRSDGIQKILHWRALFQLQVGSWEIESFLVLVWRERAMLADVSGAAMSKPTTSIDFSANRASIDSIFWKINE